MPVERALFLTIAVLTHGIVGYALVRAFTDVNPTVGFLLGILPDVDFLFPAAWGAPFIHRGITHTSLFLIAIVTVASLWRSRKRLDWRADWPSVHIWQSIRGRQWGFRGCSRLGSV